MTACLNALPKKRKLRTEVFDILHAAAVERPISDTASWVAQCEVSAPPPPPHSPPQRSESSIRPPPPKRLRVLHTARKTTSGSRILRDLEPNRLAKQMEEARDPANTRARAKRAGKAKATAAEAEERSLRRSQRNASRGRPPQSTGSSARDCNTLEVGMEEEQELVVVATTSSMHKIPPKAPVDLTATTSAASSSTHRNRSRSLSPRKGITQRRELVHLNPRVDVIDMDNVEDAGFEVHKTVRELWKSCEEELTTNAFVTKVDKPFVERTLQFVLEQAKDCRTGRVHESQWIAKVILPLLNLLEQLQPFASRSRAGADDKLGVFDIRGVEIASKGDLVPVANMPSIHKDLDKKIDLALGLHLSLDTQEILQTAKTDRTSINQSASFVSWNPLFLNIEVKRNYVNVDPVVQLAAWAAAEFKKRWNEEWDVSMPVLALEIDGEIWSLHVVAAQVICTLELGEQHRWFKLAFIGTLNLGDTRGKVGLRRLFANLCNVVQWGRTSYLKWFKSAIVDFP